MREREKYRNKASELLAVIPALNISTPSILHSLLNLIFAQNGLGHKMALGTCWDISASYEAIFFKF